MRALIIGCGYVGSEIGRLLAVDGHSVTGVTRTNPSAPLLSPLGIQPLNADCSTLEGAGKAWEKGADVLIFCVSSKGGDYRRTYLEGMRSTLKVIKKNPPALFIHASSASVYAQQDGEWVTESSPTEPFHENGKILIETEQLLEESIAENFSSMILRISGIYGPGRHRLLDQLREGTQVLPGKGNFWMNQVHRDDVAGAIFHLIKLHEKNPHPRSIILNLTDDTPVLQRDYVEWCCNQLGRQLPSFDPAIPVTAARGRDFRPHRRISNRAIRDLGWKPRYPSYREGLPRTP